MEIDGKRFLVAGGGVLGSRIGAALTAAGARVALTAREPEGGGGAIALEITDGASRETALDRAESDLGGLDGLIVGTGVAGFGAVGEIGGETEERLMAVNAVGPMRLIGSAADRIGDGGTIVALTAVVAEYPTAGMAAYSASKAALSAYVTALRREQRRRISVIDVRPGHMETGFAARALAGEPPKMPEPEDPDELVAAVVAAIEGGKREVAYDPMKRTLSVR